jgi:hypothetical protein
MLYLGSHDLPTKARKAPGCEPSREPGMQKTPGSRIADDRDFPEGKVVHRSG